MAEAIDEHFVASVRALTPGTAAADVDPARVLALFDAQLQSRHLDLAARWLQAQGEGFYTIGSAGHEANAALGLLTRVDDPALLHYRSGGFYAARAARNAAERPDAATTPVRDVLLGLGAAAADPISGGRHKVFGHPALHIVPQTSTIASHLPRAVGLAFTLGNLADLAPARRWPADAVVVTSLGDASVNHSTAQGALNAASYLAHRGLDLPLLVAVEDNGLGISTRTPPGWLEATLRRFPGIEYVEAASARPDRLLADVGAAVDHVRHRRRPVLLHLRTVRFLGHAGSDVELGYRTSTEIARDHERDPLLATAAYLVETGTCTPDDVADRYERTRVAVMHEARSVIGERRLVSRGEVVRPIDRPEPRPAPSRRPASAAPVGPLSLAQSINATLAELLEERPHAIVLGEDVGAKGGVYGVTRGLRKQHGGRRVIDTLLDEQTILGTALGAALAGLLPIPEIQYLAYLHNAEDQLRGEAASLAFFSDGHYRNPMVVRIPGLSYQKGFGGHFHNDNSLAVLRDIPGLVLCVPSHPADARPLIRECAELAELEGRVCVVVEPIALYHSRDLHAPGDELWTAEHTQTRSPRGPRAHGDGEDLLVVTFGNGVPMSLRACRSLEADGVRATVLDLRWLAPLPVDELAAYAAGFDRVLVVDETRRSGGVGEGIVSALLERGYDGRLARVASADSYVPLGPASRTVLVTEDEIAEAARVLCGVGSG
ncbi:transketolase C-terminal domain-containing protein [Nocardioides sp. URHA0020]|uniref:transketolase C-terminal domain-containing protein n=1 Tax=Nocardioides sp. URHA0020 TaxID=1380392 RepID=UPI0004910BA5|nr:transketolase C-terminal domain-containing protein [Nocardioides sp. URHA0020]